MLTLGLAVSTTLSADSGYSGVMPSVALVSISSPLQAAGADVNADAADVLFQADWGAANPAVFSRIATAFDADAMNGADLMAVECRASLCKIHYEADSDVNVAQALPMQLATTFHAVVTVHDTGARNLLYMDVPASH